MKMLFNLIRSLICLIGFALYAYPVYLISPFGEGMSLETLKVLGVCWVLGLLSLLFSAGIRPKVDERKDFTGDVPKLARQTRSPEEFEKWLQSQNFIKLDDKKK